MMDEAIEIFRITHEDDLGTTVAAVAPAWGANVIGLAYRAHDWQWPLPVLEAVDPATIALKPGSYGIPLLGPTPGRVGHNQNGRFRWRGEDHDIRPTRHGFLRDAAWRVENQAPGRLTCAADFEPDPRRGSFPFTFAARHEVALASGSLTSRVRLRNTGDAVAPLDVGWHPYLHRGGACRVKIPAAQRWELNDETEPTPTGRRIDVADASDFRPGRLLAAGEHWDHVFCGLATDEAGWSESWAESEETVLLTTGTPARLTVRRAVSIPAAPSGEGQTAVRNMQLYTPPGRHAICLEPLSAPPDALNLLARGVAEAAPSAVAPGAEACFAMTISIAVEAAPSG